MKRLIDIVASALALIVLSPVILVVALLVRVNLGAPVFFRQQRPGLHGKPFRMVKFRTMRDAVDSQGRPLSDAERLTRFGRLLRATSLDELPELWNVLKGEMSLVGPRPLLMDYLPLYSPEQFRRHDVRPGITGWAQVNGRNALSWDEKFSYDVDYVDRQSLALDIKILCQTVMKVVARDGISAAGEATMSAFQGTAKLTKIIGIYGSSGFGREVMSVLRQAQPDDTAQLLFIDDAATPDQASMAPPILTWDAFLAHPAAEKSVAIAIANSPVREKLHARCAQAGIPMAEVRAPQIFVGDHVEIGEGAVLQPFVTLTADAQIGRCFHANIYSYVAHDCVIGDFVTFAPNVHCNGNVVIEDHAYIGTGAIIKQGRPDQPLRIGTGAIVGMGAVVTKDVPAHAVVVGNPARLLEKK